MLQTDDRRALTARCWIPGWWEQLWIRKVYIFSQFIIDTMDLIPDKPYNHQPDALLHPFTSLLLFFSSPQRRCFRPLSLGHFQTQQPNTHHMVSPTSLLRSKDDAFDWFCCTQLWRDSSALQRTCDVERTLRPAGGYCKPNHRVGNHPNLFTSVNTHNACLSTDSLMKAIEHYDSLWYQAESTDNSLAASGKKCLIHVPGVLGDMIALFFELLHLFLRIFQSRPPWERTQRRNQGLKLTLSAFKSLSASRPERLTNLFQQQIRILAPFFFITFYSVFNSLYYPVLIHDTLHWYNPWLDEH